MEFKEKLLIVRRRLGLSQAEMALRLGVSVWTVGRLENGRYQPSQNIMSSLDSLYNELFQNNGTLAIHSTNFAFSRDIEMDLTAIIEISKEGVIHAVNTALLQRNFLIGKRIDEEILTSQAKDYGKAIIQNLSRFLTEKYGDGFEATTLYLCVRFFRAFPNIFDTVCQKSFLSWSHYRLLISVRSDIARTYYEREALASGWSVRDLQRAIHSQYYERLLSTHNGDLPAMPEGEAKPRNPLEYIKILIFPIFAKVFLQI